MRGKGKVCDHIHVILHLIQAKERLTAERNADNEPQTFLERVQSFFVAKPKAVWLPMDYNIFSKENKMHSVQ